MTPDPRRVAWLHGYTMTSAVFAPIWAELPQLRHHGIDLPGHGRAAQRPMRTLSQLAEEVADELRQSGCRLLVGLSFGSCVAIQVAIDHPGLLDALVLAGPTVAGLADDPEARAKYLLLRSLWQSQASAATLAQVWMADPPAIFASLRAHAGAYELMREVISTHSFAELGTGAMRALTQTTHAPAQLAGIQTRTLVMTGDAELPRFVAAAQLLSDLLPRCQTIQVGQAGHLSLLEQPQTCARQLTRFFCEDGNVLSETTQPVSATASSWRE